MKTVRYFLIGLIFAVLTPSSFAQTDELRTELDNFVEEQEISGAVFWGHINGETIEITSGLANRETATPTAPETRFYIASSGKMMTAAAILSLVETGALQLDQPVWPHIRELEGIDRLDNADRVTLRQLLNHTSGLAEYLYDEFVEVHLQEPTKRWQPAEALVYALEDKASFEPETSFEYSNTNYVLLGHILAKSDGSLDAALQKRVFDNANMKNSSVGANETDANLARGYDETGTDMSLMAWAATLADGPVVATAGDLGRFMRALFVEQTILSAEMLEQMITGSAFDETYGLGMGIDEDDQGIWYGHSGGYDGFESYVRHYPELDATLVLLVNGNLQDEDSFLDIAATELLDSMQ